MMIAGNPRPSGYTAEHRSLNRSRMNEDYKLYFDKDQLMAQRLIKPVGGVQVFKNPPPISMSSAGKDMVIMTDGAYKGVVGQLRRDKSGKPAFLSMQHRIFRREK